MRAALAAGLLVLALLLAPTVIVAQESGEGRLSAEELSERIGTLPETLEGGEEVIKGPPPQVDTSGSAGGASPHTGLMPNLINPAYLDEAGVRSMQDALKAFYDYRIQGFYHRARVFEWQLLSSRLIFALVILIVAIGLYFSWLQFMVGLKEDGRSAETSTTLEASPTGGIKVSSPVLGVIILTLSLAFFYLYLVYVYPIEEIF